MVYTINNEQLTRRILVTIDGSKVTTETGIPLMLRLNLPNVKAAGADVRLAKLDGTPLAREIEWKWDNDNAALHFPFDTVAGVDSQFYVYWGNPNLVEPAADSTYGSQAVWDVNHVGVWHMDNDPSGSAPQLKDSTSNGYDGTSGGAMTSDDLVDGNYGKAIDFDGSDDEFDVGNIANGLSTFSVTVKVFIDDHTVQRSFISKWWDGSNRAWDLEIETNAKKLAFRVSVDGSDATGAVCPDAITDAQWYILKGVRTPTQTRIYVNGVLKNTQSLSGTTKSNNAHTTIGAQPRDSTGTTHTNFMDSKESVIMITDNEPTLDWITTEYNNLNNPTATGIDPFYKSIGNPQHQNIGPQFQN